MIQTCIYLDLDGPMSNVRSNLFPPEKGAMQRFDPVASKALSHLCKRFNAVVVFASVRSRNASEDNKTHLFQLFEEAGFDTLYMHADWTATYKGGEKAPQIRRHRLRNPEIKKWVLIEDDIEDVESLLLVDRYNGMTASDFLSLESFLESDRMHYHEPTMRKFLHASHNRHPRP